MSDATNHGIGGSAATPPSRSLVRRVQTRVNTPAVRTGIGLGGSVVALGGGIGVLAASAAGNVSGVYAGEIALDAGIGITLTIGARRAPSPRNPIGVKSQLLRRITIAGGAASLGAANALFAAGVAHESVSGPGALALAGSVALAAGVLTGF